MKPLKASRAVAGFTLLEIVISTGILSIVLVIVYGVFARTLSQKEHTEAISLGTATARAVIHQIIRDLEAVEPGTPDAPRRTPTPSRSTVIKASEQFLFLSRNRTEHGIPFDDLAFSTSLRKPTGGNIATSDLAAVRYFAEGSNSASSMETNGSRSGTRQIHKIPAPFRTPSK
jgi:prepilin-type N-terminal cleavage/methylation domain-containing protein